MGKLEELDQQHQPNDIKKRKKRKKIEGSTKFVFVDYLFLFVFFGFLTVILLKMVGM